MFDTVLQVAALITFPILGRWLIVSPASLVKIRYRFLQGAAPYVYKEENFNDIARRYYKLLFSNEKEWERAYPQQVFIAKASGYFLFLVTLLLLLEFLVQILLGIVN